MHWTGLHYRCIGYLHQHPHNIRICTSSFDKLNIRIRIDRIDTWTLDELNIRIRIRIRIRTLKRM